MEMLDKRFKHDKSTELPEAFEEYFYKANRRNKETLFDYIGRIRLSTKKILEHKVDLPDKVRGWLLLRRAGLSEEQKTLVMSQVGTDLSFDKVASVLQTTFGEKQVPSERKKHTPSVHFAADEWDEPYDDYAENFENYDHHEWEEPYGAEEYGYEEWHDAEDEFYGEDDVEDWYDADGWTERAHDVDEYDDVYSAYVEARQRMNELRLARGFYPIVALAPGPGAPRAEKGFGRGKGRGKARKGTKGGSKSKTKGPPRPKGKGGAKGKRKSAPRPTFRPRPTSAPSTSPPSSTTESVCLRCGKTGHWARECPMPPRKRPNTGERPDEKSPQRAPKQHQKSTKRAPKEHPKRTQRAPRSHKKAPKEHTKSHQRAPKEPQRVAKEYPKRPQRAPKSYHIIYHIISYHIIS